MDNSLLKNFSRVKKYAPKAVIAGEGNSEMVVVLKGELGVFDNYKKKNEKLTGQIGPGGAFGEAELFLGTPLQQTGAALTEVFALKVQKGEALQFIREEPEMALELMKALCMKQDCSPEKIQDTADAPAFPETRGTGFPLFPEGHGSYRLMLDGMDRGCLMEKSHVCPYCKKEFKKPSVRTSKLAIESTDTDMRHRYKGVEPLYFDVVTCPECLYSALDETFAEPDNKRADLSSLRDLKQPYLGFTGESTETAKIFAGYYLALQCAPECFTPRRLAEAKLLLKLSRVYQDCEDSAMERETARRALDAYMRYYLNEKCDPGQDQQLCLMIGELYLKGDDIKSAREFFFKAKTVRGGAPTLKEHAENRLAQIRTMASNG